MCLEDLQKIYKEFMMKLTREKLEKIILEELNNFNEQEQPNSAQPQQGNQAADATKSTAQLKKDLLDAAKNIQNVKGLDPKEIELISATLAIVMQLSSQGSASTILQRIYDVLQKKAK
jgi:hypothetical protein